MIKAQAELLSEIFIQDGLLPNGSPLPESAIYQRDVAWIHESNGVIAEVTNPSLGVGYELAYAERLRKPVLTLYQNQAGKKLSAMIKGNAYFTNVGYDDIHELNETIHEFIASLSSQN